MSAHHFYEVASIDSATTEDETPRNMGQVGLREESVLIVKVEIIALRESDLAAKAWTLESLLRRQSGVVSVLENIPSPPNLFATAADATALSAVSVAVFSDGNTVGATCTGLAGTTIHWSVRISGRGVSHPSVIP